MFYLPESIQFSKSSKKLCEVIRWVPWPGEGVTILLMAKIHNPMCCLNQDDWCRQEENAEIQKHRHLVMIAAALVLLY